MIRPVTALTVIKMQMMVYENYKMSECIIKNITYIRKPAWTYLNDNMK